MQVDTLQRIDQTHDKIDTSSAEVLKGIAKLAKMHESANKHLSTISKGLTSGHRSSWGEASSTTMIPEIKIDGQNTLAVDLDDCEDLKEMRGTLSSAWDVISNYDPKRESLSVAQGPYD